MDPGGALRRPERRGDFGARAHRRVKGRRELTEVRLGRGLPRRQDPHGHRLRHQPLRRLTKMQVQAIPGDFLVLEYAGGDKTYLPVSRDPPIQTFRGRSTVAPVDRLGGNGRWLRQRPGPGGRAEDGRETAPPVRRPGGRPGPFLFPTDRYSASSRPTSTSTRRRTRSRPSRTCWPTWRSPSRWTAWSAATWATARPRSRCAPPSRPSSSASRSLCSCRPRCSPSSTSTPSGSASPTTRSPSRSSPRCGRPPRSARSSGVRARARSTS